MGIFNFFRKIIKGNVAEKSVRDKISFSGIEDLIEKKRKENELKEKEILVIIRETIRRSTRELREKIVILESVDIESLLDSEVDKKKPCFAILFPKIIAKSSSDLSKYLMGEMKKILGIISC